MKLKLGLFAVLALLLSGCVSTGGTYYSGGYYNVTEYDDYSYDRGYYDHGPRPLFDDYGFYYPNSWSFYERQACYWEGRYCDPFGFYNRFRVGGRSHSHFDFYIASYPRYFSVSECLRYSRDPWPCYAFVFHGYDPYYYGRRHHYYGYGGPSIFYPQRYNQHHRYRSSGRYSHPPRSYPSKPLLTQPQQPHPQQSAELPLRPLNNGDMTRVTPLPNSGFNKNPKYRPRDPYMPGPRVQTIAPANDGSADGGNVVAQPVLIHQPQVIEQPVERRARNPRQQPYYEREDREAQRERNTTVIFRSESRPRPVPLPRPQPEFVPQQRPQVIERPVFQRPMVIQPVAPKVREEPRQTPREQVDQGDQ